MPEWNFRLATPADSAAFSRWAASNPNIDPSDLESGMHANNPTVLFFVAEKDGVPISFCPVYLAAMLAHMGFNSAAEERDKLAAINVLRDGVAAFMLQFGIREIQTLTEPEYGLAKWALKHGFEMDPRKLFRLNLNREMVEAH